MASYWRHVTVNLCRQTTFLSMTKKLISTSFHARVDVEQRERTDDQMTGKFETVQTHHGTDRKNIFSKCGLYVLLATVHVWPCCTRYGWLSTGSEAARCAVIQYVIFLGRFKCVDAISIALKRTVRVGLSTVWCLQPKLAVSHKTLPFATAFSLLVNCELCSYCWV